MSEFVEDGLRTTVEVRFVDRSVCPPLIKVPVDPDTDSVLGTFLFHGSRGVSDSMVCRFGVPPQHGDWWLLVDEQTATKFNTVKIGDGVGCNALKLDRYGPHVMYVRLVRVE